tara:strand:+ start:13476 stop:13646 length:171 start_codon:yes stop_codon:yes gene_type:complete
MKSLIKETSDVLILNIGTLSFVSLVNVEIMMKIVALALTIIYTTDKYIYNRKRRKK